MLRILNNNASMLYITTLDDMMQIDDQYVCLEPLHQFFRVGSFSPSAFNLGIDSA